MALSDLSFRDLEWIVGVRGVRSLRDFARLKRVRVAHASKVFRAIESTLGVTIFSRSARGIELTEAGTHLVTLCEEILIQGERLRDFSQRHMKPRDRPLTIAALSFLQTYLTLGSLQGIDRRFRIIDMNPILVPQFQLMSEVDLFLHLGPVDWPDSIKTLEIGPVEFGFFMHSNFLPKNLKLKDLYELPFVIPTYLHQGQFVHSTDRCPIPMHLRVPGDETTTASQALQLLARRKQISFLPKIAVPPVRVNPEIQQLTFSELPTVSETLYLSAKTDTVPQKLLITLVKQLKAGLR